MNFFLDTAIIEDIKKANDMGVICGVTTNPSLIAKSGRNFAEVIREITGIVDGPISGEVSASTQDAAGMIKEGREIAKIHPNMVVSSIVWYTCNWYDVCDHYGRDRPFGWRDCRPGWNDCRGAFTKGAYPATGESWEMNAIASAVLGGTSMAGGIGTIGGTIVGAFVIGVINDGMVMCGVSEFWQMVIKGLVIVLAVIIDVKFAILTGEFTPYPNVILRAGVVF